MSDDRDGHLGDRDLATTADRHAPGDPHAPDVVEMAFLCWLEADRNSVRAARRFDETCPEEYPRPTDRTFRRWAKDHNWPALADEAVAIGFPNIRRRQLARLVILNDRAQDFDSSVLAGEWDHHRDALKVRDAVSARIQTLVGLGTAGIAGGVTAADLAIARSADDQADSDLDGDDSALADLERHRRQVERRQRRPR